MEDKRLRHFLAVAETSNFGRAAESQGLTTQGLSRSIASLEKDLGYRLFERGPFGARITPYGEALVPHAKHIVAQSGAAAAELQSIRSGVTGALAIGGGVSFMAEIVPQALARFLAQRPQIELSVSTEAWDELVRDLRTGKLDFIATTLGESAYNETDLEIDILFEQRFALFASSAHPLANRRGLTLRDVQGFPWLMNEGETMASTFVQRTFLNAGVAQPRSVVLTRLDSIFARSMMQLRDYVVHGSSNFFLETLKEGRVVELDIADLVNRRPAGIVLLKGRPIPPAARILIREIKAVVAAEAKGRRQALKL